MSATFESNVTSIERSIAEIRGPAQSDVDALRGLLDLTEHWPSNDQRARFLLSSNWMRDRMELAGQGETRTLGDSTQGGDANHPGCAAVEAIPIPVHDCDTEGTNACWCAERTEGSIYERHPDVVLDNLHPMVRASAETVLRIDRTRVTWSTLADADWESWVFLFAKAGVVLPAPAEFVAECDRVTVELNERLREYRERRETERAVAP